MTTAITILAWGAYVSAALLALYQHRFAPLSPELQPLRFAAIQFPLSVAISVLSYGGIALMAWVHGIVAAIAALLAWWGLNRLGLRWFARRAIHEEANLILEILRRQAREGGRPVDEVALRNEAMSQARATVMTNLRRAAGQPG